VTVFPALKIHHLQKRLVWACELGGIKPDRKMQLQGIVGNFGSRTPDKEASAVP
jgi:hypothetical protein